MELVNNTAFPAFAFRQFDRTGGIDAVLAVRGTFDLVPGTALAVAADQEAFQWEDTYEGDQAVVPLMRQGDLVPFKPGTDVTVLATSYCPDPRGGSAWTCGLRIGGPAGPVLDKQLAITGPRLWQPVLRPQLRTLLGATAPARLHGWELTLPEPAHSVDLDWRLAQGGPGPDGTPNPANPVGRGIVGTASPAMPVPAPQIGPATGSWNWQAAPVPAGLGPLAPWWHDRLRHAGTGGLVWLDEHRPVLPADFDERFWQCAPPDQVVTPYLRGTERYTLLNLFEGYPTLVGHLPGIMLGMTVERPGTPPERLALDLDGVHFDLRPGWDRVILCWRRRLPMPRFHGVRLTLAERIRLAPAEAAA